MRPGLYPLLGRVSPVWEIYFLWPAEPEREEQMIRSLDEKGVDWALVTRDLLDGRPELSFENSHPRIWQHLEREFERVAAPGLPRGYRLLRRRESPVDGDDLLGIRVLERRVPDRSAHSRHSGLAVGLR